MPSPSSILYPRGFLPVNIPPLSSTPVTAAALLSSALPNYFTSLFWRAKSAAWACNIAYTLTGAVQIDGSYEQIVGSGVGSGSMTCGYFGSSSDTFAMQPAARVGIFPRVIFPPPFMMAWGGTIITPTCNDTYTLYFPDGTTDTESGSSAGSGEFEIFPSYTLPSPYGGPASDPLASFLWKNGSNYQGGINAAATLGVYIGVNLVLDSSSGDATGANFAMTFTGDPTLPALSFPLYAVPDGFSASRSISGTLTLDFPTFW